MIVYNELAVGLDAEIDKRGFVVTDEKVNPQFLIYSLPATRANSMKQIYTAWNHAVISSDTLTGEFVREIENNLLLKLIFKR